MHIKWIKTSLFCLGMAALSGVAANAQNAPSAAQTHQAAARTPEARPETDIGVGFYQAMNASSQGIGTSQTPTNAAGGMLEVRHITSPWIGYEVNVSFNPEDFSYKPTATNCGFSCSNAPQKISNLTGNAGLAWVVSHPMGNLRPFATAGIGFMIFEPDGNVENNNPVVRLGYVFGGGVDWSILPRFGLRFQVRDSLYKAPNLLFGYNATGQFTHTLQPIGGAYFRF